QLREAPVNELLWLGVETFGGHLLLQQRYFFFQLFDVLGQLLQFPLLLVGRLLVCPGAFGFFRRRGLAFFGLRLFHLVLVCERHQAPPLVDPVLVSANIFLHDAVAFRSEERRVGEACTTSRA